MPELRLSQDPAADALLSRDPLALLLGMMLDQQIPMEKAFRGPEVLRERLGHDLDAHELAERDDLAELFAVPPAVHRFPGSMATRTAELARHLVERYGGDAAAVWSDAPTGEELLRRLTALPGFGEQKARIFLALLGKQLGVRPTGWREAAGPYGEDGATRSVADVTGPETLLQVRAAKQAAKQAPAQHGLARAAEPELSRRAAPLPEGPADPRLVHRDAPAGRCTRDRSAGDGRRTARPRSGAGAGDRYRRQDQAQVKALIPVMWRPTMRV